MGIRRLPASAIGAFSGFLFLRGHFLAILAFAALACARGFADARLFGVGLVPLVIGAATILAALAAASVLMLAILGPHRRTAGRGGAPAHLHFLRWMAALVAGLSLVAIVWSGLPVLFGPACQ